MIRGRSKPAKKPLANQKIKARAKELRGPTTATFSSVTGSWGSAVILETPPKMNSVISEIWMPELTATREWASSWITTEAKKKQVAMAPASQ